MNKLPVVSGRQLVRALGQIGFAFDRQRGSHMMLFRSDPPTALSIPDHHELDRGTLRALLRQAPGNSGAKFRGPIPGPIPNSVQFRGHNTSFGWLENLSFPSQSSTHIHFSCFTIIVLCPEYPEYPRIPEYRQYAVVPPGIMGRVNRFPARCLLMLVVHRRESWGRPPTLRELAECCGTPPGIVGRQRTPGSADADQVVHRRESWGAST